MPSGSRQSRRRFLSGRARSSRHRRHPPAESAARIRASLPGASRRNVAMTSATMPGASVSSARRPSSTVRSMSAPCAPDAGASICRRLRRQRPPHHTGQPPLDERRELLDRVRLRQVVVHAGREAALALALHRVRGDRGDRRVPARAFAPPDLGGRGKAVHLRHLRVHEDQRVVAALQRLERLPAVVPRRRRDSRAAAGSRSAPSD